jgi:hypothetical protein
VSYAKKWSPILARIPRLNALNFGAACAIQI